MGTRGRQWDRLQPVPLGVWRIRKSNGYAWSSVGSDSIGPTGCVAGQEVRWVRVAFSGTGFSREGVSEITAQ